MAAIHCGQTEKMGVIGTQWEVTEKSNPTQKRRDWSHFFLLGDGS